MNWRKGDHVWVPAIIHDLATPDDPSVLNRSITTTIRVPSNDEHAEDRYYNLTPGAMANVVPRGHSGVEPMYSIHDHDTLADVLPGILWLDPWGKPAPEGRIMATDGVKLVYPPYPTLKVGDTNLGVNLTRKLKEHSRVEFFTGEDFGAMIQALRGLLDVEDLPET